jgi:hypothetical protein
MMPDARAALREQRLEKSQAIKNNNNNKGFERMIDFIVKLATL